MPSGEIEKSLGNVETGKRLKEARELANRTQQSLADYIGVSKGSISGMEHGRHGISRKHLSKISEYLDTDPIWLTNINNEVPIIATTKDVSSRVMAIAKHIDCLTIEKQNALALILGIKL